MTIFATCISDKSISAVPLHLFNMSNLPMHAKGLAASQLWHSASRVCAHTLTHSHVSIITQTLSHYSLLNHPATASYAASPCLPTLGQTDIRWIALSLGIAHQSVRQSVSQPGTTVARMAAHSAQPSARFHICHAQLQQRPPRQIPLGPQPRQVPQQEHFTTACLD
jgi:hypothetical protein